MCHIVLAALIQRSIVVQSNAVPAGRTLCWTGCRPYRGQDGRQATCNGDKIGYLYCKNMRMKEGMRREGVADWPSWRPAGRLKFMPKCIRRRYSLVLCIRMHRIAYRKRRDLVSNQLIMVTHCPTVEAARCAACTLAAHLLHTVAGHRPLVLWSTVWRLMWTGFNFF